MEPSTIDSVVKRSLKQLKARKEYTGSMVGKSYPIFGSEGDSPIIRRKLLGGGSSAAVKINSYIYAACEDADVVAENGKYFSEYA